MRESKYQYGDTVRLMFHIKDGAPHEAKIDGVLLDKDNEWSYRVMLPISNYPVYVKEKFIIRKVKDYDKQELKMQDVTGLLRQGLISPKQAKEVLYEVDKELKPTEEDMKAVDVYSMGYYIDGTLRYTKTPHKWMSITGVGYKIMDTSRPYASPTVVHADDEIFQQGTKTEISGKFIDDTAECECGCDSIGSPFHADYCPKFNHKSNGDR